MRNKVIVSVLLFLVASGLTWAQFWKSYSDSERRSLSEAYWLAGSQYQAVGKPEKGAEYRSMAKLIDPALDPAAIVEQALPSAAELLAQGKAAAIGQGSPPPARSPLPVPPDTSAVVAPVSEADPSAAITDAFKESMTAILSKDVEAALRDVSSNVRFLRLRQTVTKEELKTSLLGYFDKADFPSAMISDALDLSSIFVEPADSPVDAVSGPVYELNVKSTEDLSAGIPFWGTYMRFYFVKEGEAWSIFAIM